jgi:hypothetical protein
MLRAKILSCALLTGTVLISPSSALNTRRASCVDNESAGKGKDKKGFTDCKNPACHSYAEMLMSSKQSSGRKSVDTASLAPQRPSTCPVDKDELGKQFMST